MLNARYEEFEDSNDCRGKMDGFVYAVDWKTSKQFPKYFVAGEISLLNLQFLRSFLKTPILFCCYYFRAREMTS